MINKTMRIARYLTALMFAAAIGAHAHEADPFVTGLQDPEVKILRISDHLKTRSERIRQYWRMNETGNWHIVHEGKADYQAVHFKGIPETVRPLLAGG